MGNTYLIHTEAKVNDCWRCIDGLYMHKHHGESEERLDLYCTYINGSRSYFGETYDQLRYIGNFTKFSDLSKEVQEHYPSLRCELSWDGSNKDEEANYVTVPWKTFVDNVPKGYQYHGILHKNTIFSYENGDISELYLPDEINLSSMTDLERQCYQYYEWDDEYGWPKYFKIVKEFAEVTINKYLKNTWELNELEFRLVVFCL